jgi:hypothetical protein
MIRGHLVNPMSCLADHHGATWPREMFLNGFLLDGCYVEIETWFYMMSFFCIIVPIALG